VVSEFARGNGSHVAKCSTSATDGDRCSPPLSAPVLGGE
jgi:hypothetical protein